MTRTESPPTPFAEAFGSLPHLAEPAWLTQRRREGLAAFEAQGVPTRRDEEWRYLDLSPLLRIPFRHAARTGAPRLDRSVFEAALRSTAGAVADSVLEQLARFRPSFLPLLSSRRERRSPISRRPLRVAQRWWHVT